MLFGFALFLQAHHVDGVVHVDGHGVGGAVGVAFAEEVHE